MRRVLIADDEPFELLMLQSMLARLFPNAFAVETAENGRQAIALAETFLPEIIILDIEMPGIDGLVASQQLRTKFPNAVLYFLTAHEVFTYAQQACQVGAAGYLLKPISDELLQQSICRALEQLDAQDDPHRDHHLSEQLLLSLLLSGSIADDLPCLLPKGHSQLNVAGTIAIIDGLSVHDAPVFSSALGLGLPPQISYVFCEYEGLHLIWFVFRNEIEHERVLSDALLPAIAAVAKQESPNVRITVGKMFGDLANAHDAFSSAYLARPAAETTTALLFCKQEEEILALCKIIHQKLIEDGVAAAVNCFTACCKHSNGSALLQQLLLYLEANAAQDLGRPFPLRLPEDLKFRDEAGLAAWAEHSLFKYRTRYEDVATKDSGFGVHAVRQYIRDHYASEISLAEVASAMNYSEAYFSRLFSQHFGQSFTAYLAEVRMQAAQSLLIATNRSIHHIGEAVGYRNQNYFAKAFRKATGYSPSTFRANHHGKGLKTQ